MSSLIGPAAVLTTTPWSLTPKRLGWRAVFGLGAGSVIASFYIGTGDVSIATNMGALFGFKLWWTYFVLGVAGWALIDMSVRYFLSTGRTPMSIFKDVHPGFSVYLFVSIVVCAIFGSYSQWNACAMVLAGLFPGLPTEAGGAIAALSALGFLTAGAYARLERTFVLMLGVLITCLFASALRAGLPWGEAFAGLVPQAPGEGWFPLFMSNAGSMINAWLILIYPYTMIERGWHSADLQRKVDLHHMARLDYSWGILAGGVVALPLMASANAIARPFGIVPRSYMDLSILLEPLAGPASTWLFLSGLFLAAWTSGVGWWLGGAYALMDLFNLPIKLDSKPMRACLILMMIPSVALLLLRINPVYQILIFAAFLAVVFPVIGLVLLWRVTRPDMGYFRWSLKSPQGVAIVLADLFAVGLSIYIGWVNIGDLL
jgi:Mn2+/Fe2+ NRAMP family transporter